MRQDHLAIPRRSLLVAAAIVAAGLLAPAAPAQADVLDRMTRAGKIRISVDPAAPPYSSKDGRMEFVGSEVEVAALLATDWGLELELVPTSAANRIPYLLTDKTDAVISTLSITPEREKVIDFSVAYSGIQIVVAAPRQVALVRAEELVGKSVAVVRGSTNDTEVTKVAPPGTNIIRFEDDATAITALLSGQAQFYGTAPALLIPLNQRLQQAPQQFEPKVVVKTNLTGIGVRKGETRLKERLDVWVRENVRNGKLAAIYRKYYRSDLPNEVARAAGV